MKKSVRQLLRKIYGGRADVHLDLYGLSNQHRRKHGRDCDMFPSDPLQAPLWAVLASLTEQSFEQRGLSARIRVLRGRGQNVLPRLKGRYDIVFLDGDWREYPGYIPYLRRLTRPGSIVVTANLNPLFGGWGGRLPGKQAIQTYLRCLARDPHFRTYVVPGEWHSISVRV